MWRPWCSRPCRVFEMAVACEVFGIDRQRHGRAQLRPAGRRRPAAARHQRRRLHASTPRTGSTTLAGADTIIVPGWPSLKPEPPPEAARRPAAGPPARRPVRVAVLWRLRAGRRRPARRPPGHDALDVRRRLRPPLPRRSRSTPACSTSGTATCWTSAGTAAGIDLCLHFVRHGPRGRGRQRRRPAHGGAAPPRRRPGAVRRSPGAGRPATTTARRHTRLERAAPRPTELTVEDLASRAPMCPRTFARRFKARHRHDAAAVARSAAGPAGPAPARGHRPPDRDRRPALRLRLGGDLRQHFARVVGTSPVAYREDVPPSQLIARRAHLAHHRRAPRGTLVVGRTAARAGDRGGVRRPRADVSVVECAGPPGAPGNGASMGNGARPS